MAYADELDPATPVDGGYAGQGDDEIRKKTRAIRQRLATIFQDVDADPLEFLAGIIATASLADRAVTSVKIALDAIIEEHYADNSIPRAALKDATVGTAELIDEEVTTVKLAPKAVTLAKLADALDLSTKLADASIPLSKLNPAPQIAGHLELISALVGNSAGSSDSWQIHGDGSIRNGDDTTDGTLNWYIGVDFRPGDHIRKIRARFYRGEATAQFTARLIRVADGVLTEVRPLVVPAGVGWAWADSGPVDDALAADGAYMIHCFLQGSGGDHTRSRLQFVEVTRDRVAL